MSIEYLAIVLVVILFSMILHEISHGLIALWLGDDTAKTDGRLTLNPIKHIDPILSIAVPLLMAISGGPIFGGAKPVPINPYRLRWAEWGMALVAISGPLTNFILAFIFIVCLSGFSPEVGSLADTFFKLGFSINMGFCIFNLIPIPPLDGSRVLYALAPDGVRRVMETMEKYGLFIVFAVIILFGGLFSQILIGGIYGLYDFYSQIFNLTPL